MLSLILRNIFLSLGNKKRFFSQKLLRPFVSVNRDCLKFSMFYRYFKNYQKYWIPYSHAPTFLRTLSIRVRDWCAPWACASEIDAHPEHTHQFITRMLSMRISFPIFQMFILYTLSMRVRNWCVHWACASGTDASTEHARQELMRTLSMRVRNWCVHWACASGTNACTVRIPFKKCWAYASGTDAYPEHTGQELMRSLSIRVRNWCLPWA